MSNGYHIIDVQDGISIHFPNPSEMYEYKKGLIYYLAWLKNLHCIYTTGLDLFGFTSYKKHELLANIDNYEKEFFSERFPFNYPDEVIGYYYLWDIKEAKLKSISWFSSAFAKNWAGLSATNQLYKLYNP